ncbi:BatA domain-containing protein [Marinoscillum sp.]|uniref:BatA domain-containing protein n=1 Tax=Marinoscillum sp. TaxID=2024838 RepID=UPI003BA98E28
MNFGAPIFLYALAAIAIPVVIHLWSKNTKSKVPFGSLKFLKETETKTTRHLFPSELLLLVVRTALVACLVLLFAQPFIYQQAKPKTAHLLDPNLDVETLIKIKNDIVDADAFWLSTERTPINEPISIGNINTWTSLKQFRDYDSLVVYSSNLLSNFKSDHSAIPASINWISLPVKEQNEQMAVIEKQGASTAIQLQSNGESLTFDSNESTDGEPVLLEVILYADDTYEELASNIETALKAINNSSLVSFRLERATSTQNINPESWLIWLSDDKAPQRLRLIYYEATSSGFQKQGKQIYSISNLSIKEMLQTNFPLQLETALLSPLNSSLDTYDQRQIPTTYLTSGRGNDLAEMTKHSLLFWAVMIFLGLLLLERLLSQIVIKK